MTTLNGTNLVFDFIEEYGISTNYLFEKSTANEGINGFCYSNAEQLNPIAEYDLTIRNLRQFNLIKDFFEAIGGSQNSFLFLDPIDHYAHNEVVDTGLGVTTQGVILAVDGQLRLAKRYILETTTGNYQLDRLIKYPQENNITVYDANGNPLAVTIDFDTGVITGGAGAGSSAFWSGFFFVKARLDTGLLPLECYAFSESGTNYLYESGSVIIREVKEDLPAIPQLIANSYQHEWALPTELGYSTDLTRKTQIDVDGSGFEKRTATTPTIVEFNYPRTLLNYNQKEYLITLWRFCLGTHADFILNDTDGIGFNNLVYFVEPFNIITETYRSEFDQLFAFDNIKLKEVVTKTSTRFCHCWSITRRDGQTFFYTNHDFSLQIGADIYSPKGSYNPNSPSRSAEAGDIENIELASYLTEDIIESDIITDKFKDAEVNIFYYDWENGVNIGSIFTGYIKSYSVDYLSSGANSYSFNVKSSLENLNVEIKFETSSTCRAEFLSLYCGRSIDTTVRQTRTITNLGVNVNRLTIFLSANSPDYDGGLLTFDSGQLLGVTVPIVKVANNNEAQLLWKTPILPEIGDTVVLTKKCGKFPNDCFGYGNIENFRAEPSVPSVDQVRNTP